MCPPQGRWVIFSARGRHKVIDLSDCTYLDTHEAQFDPLDTAKYVSQDIVEYCIDCPDTTAMSLHTMESSGAIYEQQLDFTMPWEPWMGDGRPDGTYVDAPAFTLWRAPSRQVIPHRPPSDRTWNQGRLCVPALDLVVMHLCYLAGGISWHGNWAWLGEYPGQPYVTVSWPTCGPGAEEVPNSSLDCWHHARSLYAQMTAHPIREPSAIHIHWNGDLPEFQLHAMRSPE